MGIFSGIPPERTALIRSAFTTRIASDGSLVPTADDLGMEHAEGRREESEGPNKARRDSSGILPAAAAAATTGHECACNPGSGEGLDLVDEEEDEGLRVLRYCPDLREELRDELSGLAEPLREESMRIDFDQLGRLEAANEADRKLLREGLADRRLPRTWGG
eukprot:gene6197-biopygen7508